MAVGPPDHIRRRAPNSSECVPQLTLIAVCFCCCHQAECQLVTQRSLDVEMPWGAETEMGRRRQCAVGQAVRVLEIDLREGIVKVELPGGRPVWLPIPAVQRAAE